MIAIGTQGDSGYPLQDTRVTFAVNHWYRGGSQSEVTVDMWAPSQYDDEEGEFGASYGIGSRLLVSGEPRWGGEPLDAAVAWSCGFTRYWDEDTDAEWDAIFQ